MFKYKCLILKNNQFLRDTLQKLGYIEKYPTDNEFIITTNDGYDTSIFTTIKKESVKNLGSMFINCGKSETLFLGVAAITDEHDKFQFFTTLADRYWYNLGTYSPKGSLEFCMVTDRHMGKNPLIDNMVVPAKKSTIEDLMINFQDKEEDTDFYSKIPEERWKKDIYDFTPYPLTEEEKMEINELFNGNVYFEKENEENVVTNASTEI